MGLIDRVREESHLPPQFNTMLDQALSVVEDGRQRDDLCVVAYIVSNAAWNRWLSKRKPIDNRQEHEWVVFANVMKIAEAEGLSLPERRVATAFAFTHDSHPTPRIMEEEVRQAKTPEQKEALEKKKDAYRMEHMERGAENAGRLLGRLRDRRRRGKQLLTAHEIKKCVSIVRTHDSWKLRRPRPPLTRDRLALACLEADAVWPLHPLGVLADLERPNDRGETKNFSDPDVWHTQLQQSCTTLVEFRPRWKRIPAGAFVDGESIFRTQEGCRLYHAWRRRWNLDGT